MISVLKCIEFFTFKTKKYLFYISVPGCSFLFDVTSLKCFYFAVLLFLKYVPNYIVSGRNHSNSIELSIRSFMFRTQRLVAFVYNMVSCLLSSLL